MNNSKYLIKKDYSGQLCVLVDEVTGQPIELESTRQLSDGDLVKLTGGDAPHKPSSEGKVWVSNGGRYDRHYYAGVIGAMWIRESKLVGVK